MTTRETVSAETASIQERTVSIHVLTVGTKQVTQALFRQLVDEDVLDGETGEIIGTVWGWVNMHVDGCAEGKPAHLHVVWEGNGKLYRSLIYRYAMNTSYYDATSDWLSEIGFAYVLAGTLEGMRWLDSEGKTLPYGTSKVRLREKGCSVNVFNLSSSVSQLWNLPERIIEMKKSIAEIESKDENAFSTSPGHRKNQDISQAKSQLEYALKSHEALRASINQALEKHLTHVSIPRGDMSAAHFKAKLEQTAEELSRYNDTYHTSVKAIEDKGQLFIAVSGVWK